MRCAIGRWTRFAIGLALLAGMVGLLHVAGSYMPGAAGALIAQNRAQSREVYAYSYGDLGDLHAFLDDGRGVYGKAALRRVLRRPGAG
jgi:hypothetical protein